MIIQDVEFNICEGHQAVASLTERSNENGILQLDLALRFAAPTEPEMFPLSFSLPYHGIAAVVTDSWGNCSFVPRPEWSPTKLNARLSQNSPMLSCVGYDDLNRYTVAISDVKTPVSLEAGVVEETGDMRFTIRLFTSRIAPITEYHTVIYIDRRNIPYYDAMHDLEVFWQAYNDLLPCPVPDAALHPLYSFWYSFHQKFTTDEVVAECARAKALGMNTVILDDGWQTDDNSRGYAYCGDWEIAKSKIPDIRALTDAVHALDMKILFWFSVPYVGKHAACFDSFKGMYLDEGKDTLCLDPRFPAVREFLIQKWIRAMKEWNLDGLKLDFIDAIHLTSASAIDDPRMDEVSLERGIEKLLSEAYAAITQAKPDALIEFRQSYVGPTVKAYGNMLRVADCPNDAHSNRTRSMQLRLLSHSTAIHSDMLMWHKSESPEHAARQIAAVFFTVPQISVRLDTVSEEQKAMLRYYLDTWEAHREVLLSGELIPHSPDCHFPLIEAQNEKERFAVSYTRGILTVSDAKPILYVNATEGEGLYIDFKEPSGVRRYAIHDCQGNLTKEGVCAMKGVMSFPVPPSGILEIF